MRTRKKKWTAGELADNPLIIRERPPDCKEPPPNWREMFGVELSSPLYVEIGCGKGGFVRKTAADYPEACFVAVEKEPSVLAMAARYTREAGICNVRFINAEAAELGDWFANGEADGLFLNFSDPWRRKKKWVKRRLTHRSLLAVYAGFLSENGAIYMKTDNAELFDFSIDELTEAGWRLKELTRDLHGSDAVETVEPLSLGLATTEYEERFMEMNLPIYRLVADRVM